MTKSVSDRRMGGNVAGRASGVAEAFRGGGLWSRISSQRSIRSRYVGRRRAKNSMGAYPWRRKASTLADAAIEKLRRNLRSEREALSRSITIDG